MRARRKIEFMEHGYGTHTVFNQTPPLTDYNLFASDVALQEAVQREGAAWAAPELSLAGAELGTCTQFEHGRLANRFPPVLHNFDVRGERIDSIEFHPSWHALMRGIAARGYHSSPWAANDAAVPGAHAARAASYMLQAQIERHTVPDDHDLRRNRGAAARFPAGARLGASAAHARIRCARYSVREKARRPDRHGR